MARQSPKESATKFDVGKRKKGLDGNFWVVTKTSAGVKRWQKCSSKTTTETRKKSAPKNKKQQNKKSSKKNNKKKQQTKVEESSDEEDYDESSENEYDSDEDSSSNSENEYSSSDEESVDENSNSEEDDIETNEDESSSEDEPSPPKRKSKHLSNKKERKRSKASAKKPSDKKKKTVVKSKKHSNKKTPSAKKSASKKTKKSPSPKKQTITVKKQRMGKRKNTFIAKDKIRKKEYTTHFATKRPYTVKISKTMIEIFNEKQEKIYTVTDFDGYWYGHDYSPYQIHGNTILIKLNKHQYIRVGGSFGVYKFDTQDEIYDYDSSLGNNDIPYTIAFGNKFTYFNKRMIKNADLEKFGVELRGENNNKIYGIYYGQTLKDQTQVPRSYNIDITDIIDFINFEQ